MISWLKCISEKAHILHVYKFMVGLQICSHSCIRIGIMRIRIKYILVGIDIVLEDSFCTKHTDIYYLFSLKNTKRVKQ